MNHSVDNLRAMFPDWNIMRSNTGRLWATHREQMPLDDPDPAVQRTVDADTLAGLAAVLTQQEANRAKRQQAARQTAP